MVLYSTSPDESFSPRRQPRTYGQLSFLRGEEPDHIIATTEPLAGLGGWIHRIDVPDVATSSFECAFHNPQIECYAIPVSILETAPVSTFKYEELTGNPWNVFHVLLMDKRKVRHDPNYLGSWTMLWVSRPGIVTGRVVKKDDLVFEIEITLTDAFDINSDYVLAEVHDETKNVREARALETWEYESLAGIFPNWATFPTAWQSWVQDERVYGSAITYLKRNVPEIGTFIDEAHFDAPKSDVSWMWRKVADEAAISLTRKLGRPVSLGKFPAHSWTAVYAIPLRIAMRIGENHLIDTPWVPPFPKPQYGNPDDSGRILFANLYGIFPKKGPGVDHAVENRHAGKIEGEFFQRTNGKR